MDRKMTSSSAKAAVRIAILENRLFLRETLVSAFEHSDMRVVAQTAEAEDFLRAVRRIHPTIAIIEFFVVGKDTPRLLSEARRAQPGLKSIVVVSGSSPKAMHECMKAGAIGFIEGFTCPFEVVSLVRAAAHDRVTISTRPSKVIPSLASASRAVTDVLTRREFEVLQYIASGSDNLKISAHLAISERTVKAHVHSIYQKLGIENRTQLALFALQRGVAPAGGS
jgi:DNA-binding NarL/FixJ family response regulator